jgi:hypothetical protein
LRQRLGEVPVVRRNTARNALGVAYPMACATRDRVALGEQRGADEGRDRLHAQRDARGSQAELACTLRISPSYLTQDPADRRAKLVLRTDR